MDRRERAELYRTKVLNAKYSQQTLDKVKELKDQLKDAMRQSDKERIDEIKAELATYPRDLGGKV